MMEYEKNIERLNEIIEKLSKDNLPLDESVKLYAEAEKVYKECNDYLINQTGNVYKIKQELEKYNEEKMN